MHNSRIQMILAALVFSTAALMAQTPEVQGTPPMRSWLSLSRIEPGTPLVIYLTNGARRTEKLKSVDAVGLTTHVGFIPRGDIAAVTEFQKHRIWDGALIGAGIGASALTAGVASEAGSEDGMTASLIFGSLVGAGLGAMIDAGTARADKPAFIDSDASSPASSIRNWTVKLRADQLSGWVADQKVQMVLKNGVFVKGKIVEANPSELLIDVEESSGSQAPGNNVVIATRDIGSLFFRENLGGSMAAGLFGGGLAGFLGGLGGAALGVDSAGAAAGISALSTAGGMTASALVMSKLNHRDVTIVVSD